MLSLKSKQAKIMHNINVLANSKGELDLHDKIELELGALAEIHAKMQECEPLMIQLAGNALSQIEKDNSSEDKEQKEEK